MPSPLYSFTSSCHSLMQQWHRRHAHLISYPLLNDVKSNRLRPQPTLLMSYRLRPPWKTAACEDCYQGLFVVSHTFLIHDWKDDFVLYENKRLSEHTINYSHLLHNINNIDKRFSQFFALFSIFFFMLFITFLYSINIIILTFYKASTQLKQSLKLFF